MHHFFSMKLHELRPAKGSKKKRTRRGRGDASGYGSFSGRGCKGQNARTGGGVRIGFEGGQTPFIQKMPKKRGFNNINRKEYAPVNLGKIDMFFSDGDVISYESLVEKKLARRNSLPIKILGNGSLTKKLTFQGLSCSSSVKEKVEKCGGKIE